MTTKISSMLMGVVLLLCGGFVNAESQTAGEKAIVLSASEMDSVTAGRYRHRQYHFTPNTGAADASATAYGRTTDAYTSTYVKVTPYSSKSSSTSSAFSY